MASSRVNFIIIVVIIIIILCDFLCLPFDRPKDTLPHDGRKNDKNMSLKIILKRTYVGCCVCVDRLLIINQHKRMVLPKFDIGDFYKTVSRKFIYG